MLYDNGYRCEDELNQVYKLSEQVHSVMGKIEREDRRVSRDREELENRLRKRRDLFNGNVERLYGQIDEVKRQYTQTF